jgi:hypothetical protein
LGSALDADRQSDGAWQGGGSSREETGVTKREYDPIWLIALLRDAASKKREFNPLMAYIEARQGRPEWLIELLRDVGFEDLAEGIELDDVKVCISR